MAQNAWDIPSSDSGKTQLSSSLHLESTAFPQRHPFCPLPEMKLVDLTELSSQVCEGLSLVTGKGTASSNSQFKTHWEEGRKEAARLKLEQTNRPSGPIFCKETPKESKKQNPAKAQVEIN